MELVSVIITAYNYAHYLPDAIGSCLAQTYRPIEIIVVDDGSTDNTREVVAAYPDVLYFYQDNRGLAAAHNTGLRHTRGEFIQLLDADDTISPTKIERCMQAFRQHPDASLVYTDFEVCTENMKVWPERRRDWPMPQGDNLLPILLKRTSTYFTNHSALVRRTALEAVNGFNERLKSAEDWFMWVRLAGKGLRFYFVDEPLAQYRMTPNSLSKNVLGQALDNLLARQELRAIPEIAAAVDLNGVIAFQQVDVAMKFWKFGRRAEARQHLRAAIQIQNAYRNRRRLLILCTYFMPLSAVILLRKKLGQARAALGYYPRRSHA